MITSQGGLENRFSLTHMVFRVMRRKAGMAAKPLMRAPDDRVRKGKCRLLKH